MLKNEGLGKKFLGREICSSYNGSIQAVYRISETCTQGRYIQFVDEETIKGEKRICYLTLEDAMELVENGEVEITNCYLDGNITIKFADDKDGKKKLESIQNQKRDAEDHFQHLYQRRLQGIVKPGNPRIFAKNVVKFLGDKLSDEKIYEIAKSLNFNQSIFLENYKDWCGMFLDPNGFCYGRFERQSRNWWWRRIKPFEGEKMQIKNSSES